MSSPKTSRKDLAIELDAEGETEQSIDRALNPGTPSNRSCRVNGLE